MLKEMREALAAVDSCAAELDHVRDAGEDDDAAGAAHLDALTRLADAVRAYVT